MMQMGHEFTDSQVEEDSEEERDDATATAKENTQNMTDKDQDNNTD